MVWYDTGNEIKHERRKFLKDKITYLENLYQVLERSSKDAFMNPGKVKSVVDTILDSKKITTYPEFEEPLKEMSSKILDSPWKYQALVEEILIIIDNYQREMQKERDEMFKKNKSDDEKKGLRDE